MAYLIERQHLIIAEADISDYATMLDREKVVMQKLSV
jgi:hypothetical protein